MNCWKQNPPSVWRTLGVCALVVLGTLSLSAVETPSGVADSASSGETRVYEVFGMDCPGCHGGLEKLVKKVPAVENAQANFKEQQLTVVVAAGQSLEDESVHDAIERANLTPGERIR